MENACRNVTKLKKRKRPLTPETINGILNALPSNPTLTQSRYCLILVISYTLLLRHDETLQINCSYLDMSEEGLNIFIPTSKTDTYQDSRFVFLSFKNQLLVDLLLSYVKS